jgi:tetratricopeptide (TPR) repeat protein
MWKQFKEIVKQQVTVTENSIVDKIIQTININLLLPWPWTVGILISAIITFASVTYVPGLYHFYKYKATENEILILISDFEDSSSRDYDAADAIEESLRKAIFEYEIPNVKLARIDQTFKRAQFEEVVDIGKKYNATLFIWGHYDDAGMYPRFTALKEEKLKVIPDQPGERWGDLATPPADFFQYVNRDLPIQMVFLTDFTLGQIFHFDKAYTQAVKLFEAAIESADDLDEKNQIPPQNKAIVFLYTGYIHLQVENNLEKALGDYEQATRLAPNSADAFNNRGLVYYRLGKFEKAISDFDRAIALDPKHAIAHHNRGLSYFSLGEITLALDDFSRAVELGQTGTELYNDRGMVYYSANNFQLALNDFDQAVQYDLENGKAYHNRGLTYYRLGKFEEAVVNFTKATELDPDFAHAYNGLCWIGSLTGKAAEVIDACERAVELAPQEWEFAFHDSRGVARALTGDVSGALDDFRFVVASTRKFSEYDAYRLKRENWIDELKKGSNPFNQSTLQELLNE